jgi:DnaJ family protein C protein 17
MSDDNKDVLRWAAEYADKSLDLYDLLGVDALTTKEDVHRAWRKRSLKYHPDKAGDNFDAEQWELFEHARDVLADASARAVYDQAMKAKLLRKQEREAMDKERQKFADDLEARENAARRQRDEKEQKDKEMMDKERERLSEVNRMREEETMRQAQAEQEMQDLAEAKRRLKEKKDEKARRKMAKEAMKGVSGSTRPTGGPANGAVSVPGNYLVDLGDGKKLYWELVCDKLQAVQAVRNLQKADPASELLLEAERSAQEARRRIQEAEVKFQREATAS